MTIKLIEILVGKYLWVIDDLRINTNKISTKYPMYLKDTENQGLNMVNRKYLQGDQSIVRQDLNIHSLPDFLDSVEDDPFSSLGKLHTKMKMEAFLKHPKDMIPFLLEHGTQSDFIYRTPYIYIISLLDSFNSKFIELLAKRNPNHIYDERNDILSIVEEKKIYFKKKKDTKIKIRYDFKSLNEIFKKKIKFCDLKKDFEFFSRLYELRQIRNLLVHELGIVNQKFLDKFRNGNYYLGKIIKIDSGLFNELVDDVILYIIFMKIMYLQDLVKK